MEKELEILKTAHGRLFNHFNNLLKDYQKHIESDKNEKINLTLKINELEKRINFLSENKPIQGFQIGQRYFETIQEVLCKGDKLTYDKDTYYIYEIKLQNYPEVYEAIISSKYHVIKNSQIRFTFDENNKLRKTRIY